MSIVGLVVLLSPLLHTSDGKILLKGLKAPVELIRDQHGIPHIKASNLPDAYAALGFIHARDRIWQMEATRRLGAGRLAEVIGEPGVRSDKMMRTLGLAHLAKRQYEQLAKPVRQSLQAYATGVNHWIATHRGALSPEFSLFGLTPEAWHPADSLLWGKLMGLRLSRNWRRELLRYKLLDRLTLKQMRDLWPAMPADDPVSIPLHELCLNKMDASFALLDQLIGPFSTASNAWAVSGKRTESGKPILANDPHLGFSIPILWYLARIETPKYSLMGATVPGMPFHILGQNKNIAWGLTTTSGDTTDLFIEKLNPQNANQYVTPSGPQPFKTHNEIIHVHDADPITIKVRETIHGPVISDLLSGSIGNKPIVLSFKATFLADKDQTPAALYQLNQAKNWPDFLKALRLFHTPQQNIMYADRAGNIGLVAAGRMPVRRHGQGWWPQAGWTGKNDWPGYISFNELPKTLNPASGIIVNANNRIVDQNYPYYLSDDFAPGYRAERITKELNRIKKQSIKTSARLQLDEVSIMAQKILPLFLSKVSVSPVSKSAQSALTILKNWQGEMSVNSPAPLIFNAWLRELIRTIASDELGQYFRRYWYVRPHFIRLVLTKKNIWCDNINTSPEIESCEHAVRASLETSIENLKSKFGDTLKEWRWGDAHRAKFNHIIFGRIPLIRLIFNQSVETGGGHFTINKGAYRYRDENRTFENVHGPGYRGVYDLADSRQSHFMIATGQSGNPLSPLYNQFIDAWKRGKSIILKPSKEKLLNSHRGIIQFVP